MGDRITYVGLDVHKDTVVVAMAEGGLRGDVREYGRIANTAAALDRLVRKLGDGGVRLRFCYEAGPCGYGIQRHLSTRGHECVVVAPSLTLSGALDPASDTGASNLDGITSSTQPHFQGSATPNATVQLFATRHDVGGPFPIGQVAADPQGHWSLTSIPLAEGTYTITASVSTSDGRVLPAVAIGAGNAGGPLVVDTTGPRVVGLTLNVPSAQIQVNFGDNLSGLDLRGASASNVASLQRIVRSRANPVAIWPLSVSDGGKSVLLGLSRPLGNGRYTFRIPAAGVRDLAGNALDGELGASFATGNGQPGGDFAATFQVARRQATPPRSIQAATPHPIQRPGPRSAPGSSGLVAARRALRHASR